jgi:RNA polymerase sigma-70 factor (ECF subfamily)
MDGQEWLAGEFEANRGHLRAVAYRMLGSMSDAEDAVQETWLRLHRSDTTEVENLGGWLTTVVARVSLDMLRSRRSRREDPFDGMLESAAADAGTPDPEREALLADAVGPALLVVLDTLTPTERLTFVLHDMFAVPFDEIAAIVGRSPAAVRQLASRARRRVQGGSTDPSADVAERRKIVDAFLAASRDGDFQALLVLLAPDVVLRADSQTVQAGARAQVNGAAAVAETFAGRARAVRAALVDGMPGAVWVVHGEPRMVFRFALADGRITAIDMMSEPDTLADLDIETLSVPRHSGRD